MTTLAQRSALRGSADGGVAARRAVVRWAWRLLRREWRQQILVVTLLSVAVAAAIGSVTVAYNTGADTSNAAEFGSASALLEVDGADPRRVAAVVAAAKEQFGTIDVIGHRTLAVPGGVETVEFRSQDPRGPYGGPRLALDRGRFPEGRSQVAVTDGVAQVLGLEIGKPLTLDGRRRTVVGVVENPSKLSDEFALVSPSSAGARDRVTVLVNTNFDTVGDGASGDDALANVAWKGRGNDGPAPALAMFSVATVFLLLASLVAAAGFAVIAQRRLRQLGMLAAIGATEKHLRLVLLTNGVVVGAIGALIGAVVGLALWFAVAPALEPALDHRVDRFSLPWALLAMVVLVAIGGAAAAAWWPGRAVSRVPVTLALSARPPRPKPAHRSAIIALVLIAAGIGGLVLSGRSTRPLIVAGIVATILGTLFLGPLAIRLFARIAGHAPIAVRLALRDLARYQARSGAALAAITLALGITATVVVIAAAEDGKAAGQPPNLSNRQIRVYTGPVRDVGAVPIQTRAELDRMAARVRQVAADLGGASVIPLRSAWQPAEPVQIFDGTRVRFSVHLSRQVTDRMYGPGASLFIATPALLRHFGVDPATVDPSTDLLADPSVPTDELVIPVIDSAEPEGFGVVRLTNVQRIDSREYLGGDTEDLAPASFITLDALRRHGWRQMPSGWLIESSRPLTSDQIAATRDFAAGAGLTIETRRESSSSTTLIAIAIAAGALLALAILAMTVGLIRSESAGDLRTLAATGATAGIRRTLTAATAGALALLGALLGVAGAYLVLSALYNDDLAYLNDVPVLYLLLTVVGVPLAAGAAGWLLAGREPPAIARPVIE
jgi:putative ABC transport system permease protein